MRSVDRRGTRGERVHLDQSGVPELGKEAYGAPEEPRLHSLQGDGRVASDEYGDCADVVRELVGLHVFGLYIALSAEFSSQAGQGCSRGEQQFTNLPGRHPVAFIVVLID